VCAEENAVLSEMSREGVRMFYDPELVVYHQRRATLRGFAQQMFKYGRGRGQLLVRRPSTVRPAYLAPTALLGYVAVLPVLVLTVGAVAIVPVAAYAAAVAACAAWIARTLHRPREALRAAWLLVVLHVCYGAGVVRGVCSRRRRIGPPEPLSWTQAVSQPDVVAATDRP
jgi:succinoglycan biosynthesis protein ExoA